MRLNFRTRLILSRANRRHCRLDLGGSMTGFRSVLLTAAVATCRILLMTRRGVLRSSPVALRKSNYQAWQILSAGFTIGRPALQENACEHSGMFTSTPLIRYFAGECGSVMA